MESTRSAETLWVLRPCITWFGEQSLENMIPLWRMENTTPIAVDNGEHATSLVGNEEHDPNPW